MLSSSCTRNYSNNNDLCVSGSSGNGAILGLVAGIVVVVIVSVISVIVLIIIIILVLRLKKK